MLIFFHPRQANVYKCLQKRPCHLKKETGRRWCSKFFITTPIFYVNAAPHIGHLYSALIGDAANRFQKLKNPNLKSKFMVGTDEHGLKVKQSANSSKIEVQTFCDQMSDKYKCMFELFNVDFDDYIRTTEEKHEKATTAFWNKIFSRNLIYGDIYSGWYCVADEVFVSEKYLDPKTENNGLRYTLNGKPVQFTEEFNYKFKLSVFRNELLHWLKGDVIKPKLFKQNIMNLIEEEDVLTDISVSRPSNRVTWGIPVPGDSSQTIYVWLDALSSYLAANGYPESNFKWPPDIQIIGKDIIKAEVETWTQDVERQFHCIFWPAFLIAADIDPPKCIYCHSHWLKDNEKMSKFKGNVVDPFECSKKYTIDGLRYFLLRGGVPQKDGNFSDDKVTTCLNAELADSLGNLLSRCTGQAINTNQVFPTLFEGCLKYFDEACEELIKNVTDLPEEVSSHFEELNFYKGVEAIVKVVHSTNKFFQQKEPWRYKNIDINHVSVSLHLTMEALRVCGILLQPIVPSMSDKLLTKLSVPKDKRSFVDIRPYSWESSEHSRAQNCELNSSSNKLFVKIKAS